MDSDALTEVLERIAAAAVRAGRSAEEVTLVAVSKGRSVGEIEALYDRGHRHFGENRAAELAAKAPHLPGDIVWHFVGALQRRQAKIAHPHTDLLHSADRAKLIEKWASFPDPAPILIQVNLAREPQKHGADPDDVESLVRLAHDAGLSCRGLMIMPPLPEHPEDSRRWFRHLAEMRRRLAQDWPDLTGLSMGMTDDYEVAVEEGATLLRIGRAIFGPTESG